MGAASLASTRLAVITGGSSGIGLAIAKRFSAEGVRCLLVGRSEPRLKAAQSEFTTSQAHPDPPGYLVGNVAHQDTWRRIAKDHPDMSILVNAAGISQSNLLVTLAEDDLDSILQTNLRGSILGCRRAVQVMLRNREKKDKCIINISSLLALKGGKGATVYAASKAGILGLTRALASEVGGAGIRINALVPGYIEETAMTPDLNSKTLRSIPLMRMGKPEEVADAAWFLANNQYANNCVLNLDGGLSAV